MSVKGEVKKDIDKLVEGIRKKINPEKIILFGSQAKETADRMSDIDLCVVADVKNKEKAEKEVDLFIYSSEGLDLNRSVDLLIYTPEEWEENLKESASFASLINKKGVELYG